MSKFSLITTVFNESKSIVKFIESLNMQSDYPDEVIILDGGSKDLTVDLIKRHIDPRINIKIVVDVTCNKKHSIGPIAKGRNLAITLASNSIILVTDAGCILDVNWVREMKKSFLECDYDIVSGWYKAKDGNKFQSYLSDIFCPQVIPVNPQSFLPSSRSLGFKKIIWEKAGKYPENSYTAEDTVFDINMFALTKKIGFNEHAFVYWELPENRAELRRKLIAYGFGEGMQGIFMYKYFYRLLYLLLFPISIPMSILTGKKFIVFEFYSYQIYGFLQGTLKKYFT